MTCAIESLELFPISLPMRHRFRRVESRDAILIRGPEGWGEFSPFPEYPPEVTARWLASALEGACAIWPSPRRSQVPVNVTVPAVDSQTARDIVLSSGCRTAKVKVAEAGQRLDDDLARVKAVREALGPGGKVRIDVNAAWTLDEATKSLPRFAQFELEYVEQPVKTIEEMVELRRRIPIPIAADELIRTAADPLEVAERGAADIIVVKVQPLGGVTRALEVAERAGLPTVVSSALETSVGLAAGLAAAAALPELNYACGLGTGSLFYDDVVANPLLPVEGFLQLRRPEPDPELLEKHAATADVAALMLQRLRSAAELLA
ncbi:MAG TPA: o-succinylbenzoate synthase [Acidimicrobiia bacterium]|nr:o-succinylbenzoate synthase [Acidimicrobiia bacterium]